MSLIFHTMDYASIAPLMDEKTVRDKRTYRAITLTDSNVEEVIIALRPLGAGTFAYGPVDDPTYGPDAENMVSVVYYDERGMAVSTSTLFIGATYVEGEENNWRAYFKEQFEELFEVVED